MNNTITLDSHTIDLSTLEELRDPNLISRYPPLFQRKQNLITLDHNINIGSPSGSIKRSKTVSTINSKNLTSLTPSISAPISNYYPIQPYSPSINSKEAPSHYGNKRHRFVKFLKNFSSKSSRPTRLELLKQSISKPISQQQQQKQQSPPPQQTAVSLNKLDYHASIFMNSLYPSKSRNSIEIKSDVDSETMCDATNTPTEEYGPEEEIYEETKEFELSRRNTYLSQLKFQPMSPPQDFSAVNTIIIPPVGGSSHIINPEYYSSPIIHPNIHIDQMTGTISSNNHRSNISFAKYDLMNLDPSAMSPVDDNDDDNDDDDDDDMVEIDRTEFVLPNSSFFIPTTTINASKGEMMDNDHIPVEEEEDDDDNDSYYSFSKSPQDSNKLSLKSPGIRTNSSRIVASPIYRIIHNSPTEGRYY